MRRGNKRIEALDRKSEGAPRERKRLLEKDSRPILRQLPRLLGSWNAGPEGVGVAVVVRKTVAAMQRRAGSLRDGFAGLSRGRAE